MASNQKHSTICIVAADVSGDQNGARLAIALRKLAPGIRLVGAGGMAMKKAGVEIAVDSNAVSMVGPPDSLQSIKSLGRVWRGICDLVEQESPDVAVLIDNETFNLLLARRLRKRKIPVVFFFPPQVWFWGRWRLKWIVPLSTRVLCAFREEADLYRMAGADTVWTGHPLRDVVNVSDDSAAAVRKIGLDPERPLVALMPGSRRQELTAHCALMLSAAKILQEREPQLQFAIPLASESLHVQIEQALRRSGVRNAATYTPESYAVLSRARVVLQCAGTATIEAGLLRIPSVIIYQCPRLYHVVARTLMRVKFIGMVNILLDEMVQPEYFQAHIDPRRLAGEVWSLLTDDVRRSSLQERLAALPDLLGPTGVLETAAGSILDLLPGRSVVHASLSATSAEPSPHSDARALQG
jgi:lipid-A-disaccharide synthase